MSIAKRAAARYGLKNPSFDDVLMQECPRYNVDPDDTERWHRIAKEALKHVVDQPKNGACARCGKALVRYSQRYYCSHECAHESRIDRKLASLKPRTCERCGETYHPKRGTNSYQWKRRRFCSQRCVTGRVTCEQQQ